MVKKYKVVKKRGMAKRVIRRGGDISVEEGSDSIILPSIDETRKKQEQEGDISVEEGSDSIILPSIDETMKNQEQKILNDIKVELPTKSEVPVYIPDPSKVISKSDKNDMSSSYYDTTIPVQPSVVVQSPVLQPPAQPAAVTQKSFLQKFSDRFKRTPKTEKEKKIQEYIPNDKMAIKGGSPYVYSTIENEDLAIKESEEKLNEELKKLEDEESTQSIRLEKARKIFEDFGKSINLKIQTIEHYEDSQNYKNDIIKLSKYRTDFNLIDNRRWKIEDERNKVQKELKNIDKLKSLNKEKLAKYNRAIIVGKLESEKEAGWRQEAKSFSENATSMIGSPIINQPNVGYGNPDVSGGFNKIIDRVSVGPNANAWARTRFGDRALVEDLVRVNQNRMITPFGVPGTVAGGDTSKQFAYNIPLNKIGVGDVTARGGYSINIEDIRRKKSIRKSSKPIIIRKKIKQTSNKANIVSVGGNLNIPKSSVVVANIGKQKPLKLNIDIGPQKTDIGNFKTIKLNMSPININVDKPQSGSTKLNVDSGIIPFTFKNIETNLNNVSISMKKKMKVNP